MTRAATAPEITKLAADGQWSDVYVYMFAPSTVFAARVNQASIDYDKLTSLGYDTVTTGAYTAIEPGMTVLIGSTAGASDRGVGWARKAATSDTLYLGETSAITAQDNDYITVVREFSVWHKRPRQSADGTWWVNTDEAYSAQMTSRKPTVVMGGDRALELTGASVSTSFTLTGADSYVTTCAGATVTDGTTGTPSIAFTSAGEYLVKVVGTTSGVSSSTYRNVLVYSAASAPRNAIMTQNDNDADGWSASIQLYESTSTVRDRAKVLIFARDFYGSTAGSIGSVAGCENVVLSGWIDGKTIVYDKDRGSVSFEVKSAFSFLQAEQNEYEIRLSQGTADWQHAASVTADLALWNLLENYTTVLNCADGVFTGDEKSSQEIVAPIGSVWDQLVSVATLIGAYVTCNQYGQVICAIDTPLIPSADRGDIPVVVTLTADDWETIDIEAVQVQSTAQYIITGLTAGGTTLCSIGGGRIPDRFGQLQVADGFIAEDQDQLNVFAGGLFARDNTPYKFSISNLRGNNRLIEWGNRIGLTLSGSDNLAGLAYSGYAIVRSVTRSHDPETGAWSIDIEADAETEAGRYCTGDVPVIVDDAFPDETVDIPFPDIPPLDFPGGFAPPPPMPPAMPSAVGCTDDSPVTGPFQLQWSQNTLNGADSAKLSATAWKYCVIRAATADNPTVLTMDINWRGNIEDNLNCYGIDSTGAPIVTGTVSISGGVSSSGNGVGTMTVTFSEVSPVAVAGFKLVLNAGVDPLGVALPLYVMDQYGKYADEPGYAGITAVTFGAATLNISDYQVLAYQAGYYAESYSFQMIVPNDLSYALVDIRHTFSTDGALTEPFYLLLTISANGTGAVPTFGTDENDGTDYPIPTRQYIQYIAPLSGSPGSRVEVAGIGNGGFFNQTSYVVYVLAQYIYSKNIPQRWMTIQDSLLYNVCPQEVD